MPQNNNKRRYKATPMGRILIVLLVGVFVVAIIGVSAYANARVPIMDVSKLSLLNDSYFVYFSSSSAQLKVSQNSVMDKAISDIALDATRAVYVIGNCNVQNRGEYSSKNGDHVLAGERSQAVANYLILKGIPDYSIYIYENGSLLANRFSNNDRVEIYFK